MQKEDFNGLEEYELEPEVWEEVEKMNNCLF
jgi:hypothetical protein